MRVLPGTRRGVFGNPSATGNADHFQESTCNTEHGQGGLPRQHNRRGIQKNFLRRVKHPEQTLNVPVECKDYITRIRNKLVSKGDF